MPSDNKAKYVGTILWRHDERFENIEGEGYWLRDVPVPGSQQAEMEEILRSTRR